MCSFMTPAVSRLVVVKREITSCSLAFPAMAYTRRASFACSFSCLSRGISALSKYSRQGMNPFTKPLMVSTFGESPATWS